MVTEQADAAAASQEVPATVSEETAGAPADGQTPDIKELAASLREQLPDDIRREFASGLLGEDFVPVSEAERRAQSLADRRAVDNQLTIDKGKIDERYLGELSQAQTRLGEEVDQKALDGYKSTLLGWQGEQRRAEFEYAVKRQSVYSQLTEDERNRIGSVREATDADRIRVTLETLLSAQERLARESLPAQVNKEVAAKVQGLGSLQKFVEALQVAKGQTSSGAISVPSSIDNLSLDHAVELEKAGKLDEVLKKGQQ